MDLSQPASSYRQPAYVRVENFHETEVFNLCKDILDASDQVGGLGKNAGHIQRLNDALLRDDTLWAKIIDRSEAGACEHCRKAGRACIVHMGTIGQPLGRIETSCVACQVKHDRCNLRLARLAASNAPQDTSAVPSTPREPTTSSSSGGHISAFSVSPPPTAVSASALAFTSLSPSASTSTSPHPAARLRQGSTPRTKPKPKRPARKFAYKDEDEDDFDYGLETPSPPLPKLHAPQMRPVLLLQVASDNRSWTWCHDEIKKAMGTRGVDYWGFRENAAEVMALMGDREAMWGVLDQSHMPDNRRCRRMESHSLDCIVQIYRSDTDSPTDPQRGEAVTVSNCLMCRGKGNSDCGVPDRTPAILTLPDSNVEHARGSATRPRTRAKMREMSESASRIYDAAHPIKTACLDPDSASEHSADLGTPVGAGPGVGAGADRSSVSVMKRASGGKGTGNTRKRRKMIRSPLSSLPDDARDHTAEGADTPMASERPDGRQEIADSATPASPGDKCLLVDRTFAVSSRLPLYCPPDPDRARIAREKIVKFLHYVCTKYRIDLKTDTSIESDNASIVFALKAAHEIIHRAISSQDDALEMYRGLAKAMEELKKELSRTSERGPEGVKGERGLGYVLGQVERSLSRWKEAMELGERGP